ncbi:phage head-tail joining protein [Alterinioella nitratireducens]|uniref:phage head-tail joining protein n=1 Tax=Alterinioella nitratireducens TaxID=2735915 RepID=UPI004059380D
MALTLDQLTQARDALLTARAGGVRRFRDQNGEEVEYKSDAQMAAALAALDRQIAELAGRRTPTTLHFRTSKGL